MDRRIIDFDQDDVGDWIAVLECGHRQHVRHDPPWQVREWVTTEAGRRGRLGTTLVCRVCADDDGRAPGGPGDRTWRGTLFD